MSALQTTPVIGGNRRKRPLTSFNGSALNEITLVFMLSSLSQQQEAEMGPGLNLRVYLEFICRNHSV